MRKQLYILLIAATVIAVSCKTDNGIPIAQTSIARIDQMPDLPQPLKIIDWKKKAMQFDSLVFNFNNTAPYRKIKKINSSKRNIDQLTF